MRVVQVSIAHAQVDIQLPAAGLLAGLKFSERAGDADHLIVGDFVAEEVRLHTLRQKGHLRASQLRLHGVQNILGVSILSFKRGR